MQKNILLGVQSSTIEILENQIEMEFLASAQYLTAASWCESNSYFNSAIFFKKQSDEEREHMLKIFDYLLEIGAIPKHPTVDTTKSDFNSLKEIFELALTNEQKVTKSINRIAEHCYNVKDYSTLSFIDWFVKEQIEEEKTVKKILDYFTLLGEDSIGLYHIDQAIGKL